MLFPLQVRCALNSKCVVFVLESERKTVLGIQSISVWKYKQTLKNALKWSQYVLHKFTADHLCDIVQMQTPYNDQPLCLSVYRTQTKKKPIEKKTTQARSNTWNSCSHDRTLVCVFFFSSGWERRIHRMSEMTLHSYAQTEYFQSVDRPADQSDCQFNGFGETRCRT